MEKGEVKKKVGNGFFFDPAVTWRRVSSVDLGLVAIE